LKQNSIFRKLDKRRPDLGVSTTTTKTTQLSTQHNFLKSTTTTSII